ncbi:med21 domain-containing protein [Aspergillus homomorphus CBS 101889]|uniref:Mediator of RNA polymerase II transcription subunit 21 n=1 Tax=Aspergillus homomorphus (strain CBS 101889) TaxID=1450537 RepID=A0A395I211_ASPHC|nr:hypothetical protein BO97DRAFT_404564 [Aspergillus homomorphus CBS 101889]RAL13756.1 hypothetical protein BO97DRAFT_404564 [Aspergillus homomorphus CBS 101889]
MADILTQLQTCLDQLATQFYATLGYLTTYHDNSPATLPPNNATAAPALAKIPKNSTAPPVPASAPLAAQQQNLQQNQNQSPALISAAPTTAGEAGNTAQGQGPGQGADPSQPPAPDSPRTFAARQRELARDLVIKEQQIEYLISVLPGIGASEAQQEARIRELEGELRDAEGVREARMRELRALRGRLDRVLSVMQVGIYGNRE